MTKRVPHYVSTSNGPDAPAIVGYPSKAAAQLAADRSNAESEAMRYGGHATVHRGLVLPPREDKATTRGKRKSDVAKGRREGLVRAREIVEEQREWVRVARAPASERVAALEEIDKILAAIDAELLENAGKRSFFNKK